MDEGSVRPEWASACPGPGGVWKDAGGGCLERRPKPPPEPAGGQAFFEIFCGAALIRPLAALLIDWDRWIFFDDPPCDDLLTMGVDNPGRGGL